MTSIDVLPIYYDYILSRYSAYDVFVLVGGRASGKSFFMEQSAVISLNNNSKYTLLIVEDIETNIGAGTKDGILSRAEEFGIDRYITATKVPPEIRYANGNKVIFRGYRTDDQQKNVKSLNEITSIWYEEAENITFEQFTGLRMLLRGGQPKDRKLYLTLNPVNEDSFINHFFFDGYEPPKTAVFERFDDGRPKVFERPITTDINGIQATVRCLVIVSTYRDNIYLTAQQQADIESLKDTDTDMYEMLANGKFIKPSGAFFKEFTKGIHTCDPFIIPKEWRRYRAMDYGLDMLACYWIALDTVGRAYVYKEAYQSDTIISEASRIIADMTTEEEDIYETFAPPDMWNRRQETGKSVAEIFGDNGIWLSKASNNREQGWLDLKEWLKVYETKDGTKQANIVIFDNCTNLIRTLPQLMRDKARPNDVDSRTNHELTHAPDALRYFVAGRPIPTETKRKEPIYNFESERPKKEIDHEDIVVI